MPFPASLVPSTLSKTFVKILQKVVMKMFIKALSKPLIRKSFKIAKFTYNTLTAPAPSEKAAKAGQMDPDTDNKATEELSVVIDDLLNQLGTKFNTISEELLGKSMMTHLPSIKVHESRLTMFPVDEMSRRLDNLESAIQAGKSSDSK